MNAKIDGVIVRKLSKHEDQRGWLLELFRSDEIETDSMPTMAYMSMTKPGVVRGPHEHAEQTDLFGFFGPSDFRLYLWDNRMDSKTFGAKVTVEVGQSNHVVVIVPPGVVHAYKNVGEIDGLVFNGPNRLYSGEGRKLAVDEIRHEDDPGSPYHLD